MAAGTRCLGGLLPGSRADPRLGGHVSEQLVERGAADDIAEEDRPILDRGRSGVGRPWFLLARHRETAVSGGALGRHATAPRASS